MYCINCKIIGIKSPNDQVYIYWETKDHAASGTTLTSAWKAQHEIECLEAANLRIIEVVLA